MSYQAQIEGDSRKLNTFPVFMRVAGRRAVIFGGGPASLAKARLVAQTSAEIIIVADRPERQLVEWAEARNVSIDRNSAAKDLIAGASLVFAATEEKEEDWVIVRLARDHGVPVNCVDRPEWCDFFIPAIVNRAPVAIAIGTEGGGPVLAQILRERIEQLLQPTLGRLTLLAHSFRRKAEELLPRGDVRRRYWRRFFTGEVAHLADSGDWNGASAVADALLHDPFAVTGSVALVGAGPGAEDLLTLRAHRLLMEADVIVHDALVPETIVAMGRRDAQRIAVGKRKGCHSKTQEEINRLLIALARQGSRVVRLKSGDPLVFGRAGEEIAALRAADIRYVIVPGVTSALAAAADFELPPTLRGVASSLVFTTGHDLKGKTLPDWTNLAMGGATLAIYMGRSNASGIGARLLAGGLAPDMPVAIVENASRANRRMLHGALVDLPLLGEMDELSGPVMVLVGDAIGAANLGLSTHLRQALRLHGSPAKKHRKRILQQ